MKELRKEYAEDGIEELWEAFREEGEAQGKLKAFYRLVSPDRKNLASSDLSPWKGLPAPSAEVDALPSGKEHWSTLHLPGRKTPVRVLTVKAHNGNILQAGMDMGEGGRMLILFEQVMLASLALLLVLGILGGSWIINRAMRGVRRVTRTALAIGEDNLQTRVPLKNEGEEIDRLAAAFNSMLERIASLVQELREVSDNIAHDLKRPVTRIRGIAEMTLTQPGASEESRETAGQIIEECDQLVGTVNTMLEIARLDAAGREDPRQSVDVCALCRKAADLFGPAAEDRGMQISLQVPETPVLISGDPNQLQRALANLLDNALFYAGRGTVTLSVSPSDTDCRVTVKDEGPGIPGDLQSRIFERFYRMDPSRSEAGSGLGLSLVQSIVRAHRGEVELTSSSATGSCFTLIFPRLIPSS
jgi:signal transduction histidine kinase